MRGGSAPHAFAPVCPTFDFGKKKLVCLPCVDGCRLVLVPALPPLANKSAWMRPCPQQIYCILKKIGESVRISYDKRHTLSRWLIQEVIYLTHLYSQRGDSILSTLHNAELPESAEFANKNRRLKGLPQTRRPNIQRPKKRPEYMGDWLCWDQWEWDVSCVC